MQLNSRTIGGTAAFLTDSESAQLDAECKRLGGKLLTPRRANGKRIGLVLSIADSAKASGRGYGNRGNVTDLVTGKVWNIKGVDCGLPRCVCDALATPIRKS